MLDVGQIPEQTAKILEKNLTKLKDDAAWNMQANDQYVTGQTESELRVEVDSTTGTLFGAKHMDTLEIGISPERSRVESWIFKFHAFNIWQAAKGLGWTNRNIAGAVTIQEQQGSLMYRLGQKKNVYSAEIDPMTEQIKNELGDVFLNVKIVK